ncbi:sensor histidine kinase [Candidatus Nitrosotenuis cloacae]|uniref:sensor histidine kinase n=1 Tax=Candidatus Nitrosotenuis cloacae TaxID=1603555 RepID=UPI00227FC937|nr:HAMP domain-containing sensor histidine kinase [Candidatus Nitrosotenuis cloacae]
MLFGKTSFKISGTVGIIILLLGMTILFGMYQMSRVSNEIVNISQAYEPLQNILGEIRYHQASQADSFEKIRLGTAGDVVDGAKETFWSSNVMVKSSIQQGKRLAETGYSLASTDAAGANFKSMHEMLVKIEKTHAELEQLTKDTINSNPNDAVLLKQIALKETQLQEEVDAALAGIKKFNDESISAIEEYERVWLLVQIGIIMVVGAIALFMRHVISQISKDLKSEIDEKTRELQHANKKLQELDKMKDDFISIASHELKSPIQPIFGFAELAQSGDIDQKEAWDGVTALAKKLQGLATDVLDVTKIESNRLMLYRQRHRINEIISETCSMARTCLDKNVRIIEELDDDVEVEIDKGRIEQVLRNMLNNALKFTDSGIIRISTSVGKDELVVMVSDTGLGIPSEILPNIFGKFVTKGHERETQSGNGLGLFLCKGIIDAHGGRIAARNNRDGGATFEFTLPLAQKTVETLTN